MNNITYQQRYQHSGARCYDTFNTVETFPLGCGVTYMCVRACVLSSLLLSCTPICRTHVFGSQATLKGGFVSSNVSRRPAQPVLTRNCSSQPSLASCQVGLPVSKGFRPTRLQLTRRATTQQQRRLHATRCRASSCSPAARHSGLVSTIRQFLVDQFLPVGLLLAMLIGFLAPAPGIKAANAGLQTFTTTGIFIISGLNLKRGEASQALSARGSILYGLVTILLITPLAGFVALRLPLHPPELAFGLTVFCCMPTTLSSAVSLTQTVGGNTALALLLTVSSNLLGIFTMPFLLSLLLGATGSAVTIQPGPLLSNLLKTILLPLLGGALMRATIPAVTRLVDNNKKKTSVLSSMLLILVPWMQISKAVVSNVPVTPSALAAVLAAGIALHLVFLAFNLTATTALKLGRTATDEGVGIRRACVLVGSQKTLPIAVTVLNGLAPQIGGSVGLAVIPCVVSHLVQIVMDSMLVSQWLKQDANMSGHQNSEPRPKAA